CWVPWRRGPTIRRTSSASTWPGHCASTPGNPRPLDRRQDRSVDGRQHARGSTFGGGAAGAASDCIEARLESVLLPNHDACMQTEGVTFHHPLAFWLGCLITAIGVCLHLPMFMMAAPMHFHMAGMAMDTDMLVGMALIPGGVLLSAFGLLPRLAQIRKTTQPGDQPHWHVADSVPLNRTHLKLALVLALVLTIDVMKPASIAFVMPGMAREYGIDMSVAGYLALSALVGTAAGSVIWGRLADVFGRR